MSGLLPMGYLASSPGFGPIIGDIDHVRTGRISRGSFDKCIRSVHVPWRTVADVFSLVVSMVAFERQVGRMRPSKNVPAEYPQQARKGYRRMWRRRPSEMQDVSLCTTGRSTRISDLASVRIGWMPSFRATTIEASAPSTKRTFSSAGM